MNTGKFCEMLLGRKLAAIVAIAFHKVFDLS
jgi:hypothetical protein